MNKPLITLTQYTDPYCTWCWGWEPVMRHIEEAYGDQVAMGFCLGGLVKDVAHFHDPLNRIGGPGMMKQVAEHWEEASHRHGMPVDASVWTDMEGDFKSTWPASIAYKAAEMQDAGRAIRYMRRLREGAAAEHLFIHRREVQAELAREVGLDHERLIYDIDSGAAGKAFDRDLAECREKEVTGFPSFRIVNGAGEELMFFGFQPFPRFRDLLAKVAGNELVERETPGASEEAIVDFIRRNGKVAWREIGEVFGLGRGETEDWMTRLEGMGLVSRQMAGNGWFFRSAQE